MSDFIWDNFGIIEWVLCIEIVILLTAGFFYQIARILVRQDRHDPVIRFYRVFWTSFFGAIPSSRMLDAVAAQAIGRAMGVQMAGDMSRDQLSQLDAPDLAGIDDSTSEPQSAVRAIGRQASDDDEEAPLPKKTSSRQEPQPEQRVSICTLDVRADGPKPANAIIGVEAGELVIEITCSPEEGTSNAIIVGLVAARIGMQAYQITLLRGHYKMRKTLQIAGIDPATLSRRLANP